MTKEVELLTSKDRNKNERNNTTCTSSSIDVYLGMIERLRTEEEFSVETTRKLQTHPYLQAAKNGTLTVQQRRAFVGEQYAIQYSDACSFATLAGHTRSTPHPTKNTTTTPSSSSFPIHTNQSLSSVDIATLPSPPEKDEDDDNTDVDLFQFLLTGEVYASKLLLDHAKSVGFTIHEEDDARSRERELYDYSVTGKGQAYPSYWAKLALEQKRGVGAAAVAVNFVAWGTMCQELLLAFQTRAEYGYCGQHGTIPSRCVAASSSSASSKEVTEVEGEHSKATATATAHENAQATATAKQALAFIQFFATPIDNLDRMAAKVMQEEQVTYEELRTDIRLLQEYEVMFWDAIYETK